MVGSVDNFRMGSGWTIVRFVRYDSHDIRMGAPGTERLRENRSGRRRKLVAEQQDATASKANFEQGVPSERTCRTWLPMAVRTWQRDVAKPASGETGGTVLGGGSM